jgi:hypothetical protein
MLKVYPIVVVGEITGVISPYDPRPGFLGQPSPQTAPSGHPKAQTTIDPAAFSRPPGRVTTTYSLEVLEVVLGENVKAGDVLNLTQVGGRWEGNVYQAQGDPVVIIGQRYLFFLEYDEEIGDYTAMPFGRFIIATDGTLIAVDKEWEYLPVVADLNGRRADSAIDMIRSANQP